jgi:LacI family transcriptional regulator
LGITINDIAKLAGVSHSTVSRVLNDASARISKDTRDKIFLAAKQLNYVPNQSAKALKRGKHNVISVIAYDITDAFAVECVSAMEQIIAASPYRAMWTSCTYQAQSKILPITLLYEVAQSSDGVIIIAANRYIKDNDILNFWAGTHMPIVTIIRSVPGDIISSVTIDEELGATLLMDHLFDLRHRRIAFCRAKGDTPSPRRRLQIYLDRLKKEGLAVPPEYIIEVDGSAAGGYQAGQILAAMPCPPTAVIGYNDLIAIGLIKAFYEHRLNVPDDISVAAFDNIRMSDAITPSLTTVATDFTQMVNTAISELISLIEKSKDTSDVATHHIVKPHLVIRQSTALCRTTTSAL